jgi:formylglycine-generating enzyme required for sulfatase activity
MKMVWCPAGSFSMEQMEVTDAGSPVRNKENPAVKVELTRGFWLGKYEVTQGIWKRCMQTEPWMGQQNTLEGNDFPATFVSWDDAMEFCRILTLRERRRGRLPIDWEYTLPTEAQWERACRAETATNFSFGNDEAHHAEFGWFAGNAVGAGEVYPHQVGQKKANAWGLHDMHGNVWEWCRDYLSNTLPGARDPEVTESGEDRMLRGGAFDNAASICRAADRYKSPKTNSGDSIGFRVCLSRVQTAEDRRDAPAEPPSDK